MPGRRSRTTDNPYDERDPKRIAVSEDLYSETSDSEATIDSEDSMEWRKFDLFSLTHKWALRTGILAHIGESNLKKLLEELPDYLNPYDGFALFKLLHEAGLLESFEADWIDLVDESSGRILALTLGSASSYIYEKTGTPTDRAFDLPPLIGSLPCLQGLTLVGCRSLPRELQNLPILEVLTLTLCPYTLVDKIPEGISLEKLTYFKIQGADFNVMNIIMKNEYDEALLWTPNLAWTKFKLPALEELRFHHVCFEEMDETVLALERECINFNKSLSHLEFSRCGAPVGFKSRRKNRKEEISEEEKAVKAAMLAVIDTCPGIHTLCEDTVPLPFYYAEPEGWDYDHVYEPDFEYILRINHAGRKYISPGETPIKTNLWPKILERAYQKSADIYDHTNWTEKQIESRKSAEGMYHLLRHGPLLFSDNVFDRK